MLHLQDDNQDVELPAIFEGLAVSKKKEESEASCDLLSENMMLITRQASKFDEAQPLQMVGANRN